MCGCPNVSIGRAVSGFLDFYSGIAGFEVALATSVDPYLNSPLKVNFTSAALRQNWAFFDVPLVDGDVVFAVVQVR